MTTLTQDVTRLPVWALDVDKDCFDGVEMVLAVLVYDDKNRWVASFPGPAMVSANEEKDVPTSAEALRLARKFVWACGAKPRLRRLEK